MPFITMEGMPTVRIAPTVLPSRGRYFLCSCTSGLNFRLKMMTMMPDTHWPITVAMAAPAMPMAGRPNHPWMRMGSRMMLMIAPMDWVIMVCTVRPVDCSSRSPRMDAKQPTLNTQQMLV